MKHRALSLWLLTAATFWAAVMRFVRIDSLAPAAWFDEVWFALRARELLQTGQLHAFYPTYFGGANAGLVYLTAIVQALGIDTITSARWVLAAAGVLAVPLAYQCFKRLLPHEGERIGTLAAIFLAYTMFDVIITRVGMESGIAPTVALFVVWQMVVAARRAGNPTGGSPDAEDSSPRLLAASQPQSPLKGTPTSALDSGSVPFMGLSGRGASRSRGFESPAVHWVLAGLALGLSQYNGLHARFVLPVAAYLALDMLISGRGHRREVLRGLAIMAGAGVLVMLPLIVFFAQNPEWLVARAGVVAQSGFARYIDNFLQIMRVISTEGSYDPKTTVPGVPLLDLVQTLGFIVGMGWTLLNLHRSRGARTLLVWLVVAMLPGILTDGPNLQRMINIAAPLAGITALGWVTIYTGLSRVAGRGTMQSERSSITRTPTVGMIGIFLLLASILCHAHMVFVRWPQEPKLGAQFTAPPVALAQEAIEASAQGPVFVESVQSHEEDIIAWEFLFAGTDVIRLDLGQCNPHPHLRDKPTGYIVLNRESNNPAESLKNLFPQSYFRARDVDLGQETLGADTASWLEIPAGAEDPPPSFEVNATFAHGIKLRGYYWLDKSDEFARPGETLFMSLEWLATEEVAEDYTVFVHIGLEGAPPIAQRDGHPCWGQYPTSDWHPDEVIPDSFTIQLPENAPPGDYPIVVGMYSQPSMARLPLIEADNPLPENRAQIGTLHIAAP